MKETDYNKDYRTRENDGFSHSDPLKHKKKLYFLTAILIGLCVLLVCSLSYDNIIKPYLENRNQQTENPVASGDTDVKPIPVAPQSHRNPTAEPIGNQTSNNREELTSTPSRTEYITELTTAEILDRKAHASVVRLAQRAGVSTEGTTSEILDRITHANVVKRAKRAGVSTEGSTSEISERIFRKNMERRGY